MENTNKIVCNYCDTVRAYILVSTNGDYVCVFCNDKQVKEKSIFANLFNGNITIKN